jgi:HTH-type transcriptional repressor of NAD biosynthesis genes
MTVALVLGKFLPPHAGHLFLAETARRHADEVIVLLLAHPDEPIPVDVRHRWLEEIMPWATIRSGVATHPVDYEDPAVYDLWAATIREVIGRPHVDVLVTSEPAYGDRTAERLGARHVLVDPDRRIVPVSGTAIRADPYANWRYLAPCVRAWYVKRVSLMGAESTGTTTLTERLAREFDTAWNPEYGREYGAPKDAVGEAWASEEFMHIARVQQQREDEAARRASGILFCDTDALATAIWHEHYMGRPSPAVVALAWSRRYDLTLLTAADIPWVDDGTRNSDAVRQRMQLRFEEELRSRPEPIVEVRGSLEERTRTAIEAIDRTLGLRPGDVPRAPAADAPQPSTAGIGSSAGGSGSGSE